MKMTIVPAQITTVEDRIIGNLGFTQILLLVVPMFVGAGVFAVVPPFMKGAVYKYITIGVILMLFAVLAIRIKGKILATWLITIVRYNVRPKYYVFNKNSVIYRNDYSSDKTTDTKPEIIKEAESKPVTKRFKLDIPATAKVLTTLENPTTKLRFETNKKGVLSVRLTEID